MREGERVALRGSKPSHSTGSQILAVRASGFAYSRLPKNSISRVFLRRYLSYFGESRLYLQEAIFDNGETGRRAPCRSYKYVNEIRARPRLTARTASKSVEPNTHERQEMSLLLRRLDCHILRGAQTAAITDSFCTGSTHIRFSTPRDRFRIVYYVKS